MDSQDESQSLSTRLLQMSKASSCKAQKRAILSQTDSLPESQTCRKQEGLCDHVQMGRIQTTQEYEELEHTKTAFCLSDELISEWNAFSQSPYALAVLGLLDDPYLTERISRCIDEVIFDPMDCQSESL